MRKMLKLGVSLCIFALVAALALAGTNAITKEPIAQQELAASQAAQRAVLPEAAVFEQQELEATDNALLNELYIGKAGDAIVGYVFTAAPQGYGGPIPITLGIGVDGSVHGVSVGDLQETAGLGMKVGDEPFKSQFYGIEADPDTIGENVSTISGATISSKAFVEAVRQMFDYSKNVLGITPNAATPSLEGDDLIRKEYVNAAEAFTQVDLMQFLGDYGTIRSVYSGSAEKETVGYVFEMESIGFDASVPIQIQMGISVDGKITQVTVVDHFVSEGYTPTGDTTVFDDQFAGKDATEDGCAQGVDTVASATVSSNAIIKAVKQAVSFYNTYLNAAEEAPAGEIYEVTGYQPMKVAIALDGEGKIVSVSVVENNETPALGGTVIGDAATFEALVGKNIADAQIDTVAHCTLTCDAINEALKKAAEAFGGAGASDADETAGEIYEVTGYQPMKVAIALDDEGKIVSVSVVENDETPALGGTVIGDAATFEALVGKNIADAQIDTVAHCTLTCDAINEALKQAAGAFAAKEVQ